MASLLTHAALPFIARDAAGVPQRLRGRLVVLAMVCACAPDLDMLGFGFEVRATDALGHRGLSHSFAVAAVLALLVGALAFRELSVGSRPWWRVTLFLFAAIASHGLVDAMTVGDVGVALFAPFNGGRYFLPLRILPVCPLGVPEYLGRWGALVLANEAIFLLIPALIVARAIRALRAPAGERWFTWVPVAILLIAWAATAVALRSRLPELFRPSSPRLLAGYGPAGSDEDPASIPKEGLPDSRLVTRFDDLVHLGLFGRELAASQTPWSSSFFPAWYGAEAGRWRDGRLRLISRTVFGFQPPAEAEARAWLQAAERGDAQATQRLFSLSPTEKVDLAEGDLTFALSRASLGRTHNGSPRYWFGLCNGVATAAMFEPEPFRAVDVLNPEGHRIRFHPNDIKALLATAYYWTEEMGQLGGPCHIVAFDNGRLCSMNAGGFALATLNRLGLAHQSFLLDAVPTPQSQYYAVASARVDVVRGPYPVGTEEATSELTGRIHSLVDVRVALLLSSTTLSYQWADVRDPAGRDDTRYQRVGLHGVSVTYWATLALGPDTEILGGRWNGDPADGPDNLIFPSHQPLTLDGGTQLRGLPGLDWPLVRALARASTDADSPVPTVDLPALRDGGT